MTKRMERGSGVLLHLSSLPEGFGIGDLGPAARRFADFLSKAGQSYWQMLPVGPVGEGNSPYSSTSAFAGNPLFVSPELLLEDGLLEPADFPERNSASEKSRDEQAARNFKAKALRKASGALQRSGSEELWRSFRSFLGEESCWIEDYSWFAALKERFNGAPWTEWPDHFKKRDFRSWDRDTLHFLGEAAFRHQAAQFFFHRQWAALSAYRRKIGVRLIGDVPIFAALDSADVWAHQELFELDESGRPTAVSGVPPDYFSKTGQLWGNPLYRWDVLKSSGYEWWARRLQAASRRFDLVRLDHFIGFARYWRIPAGAKTAAEGRWVPGPGADFFSSLIPRLGGLGLIAEDLGAADADVYSLRDRFDLPGMRVLQFSFGGEERFLPRNYPPRSVAYTGTHDNDTIAGWIRSGPQEEVRGALDYRKKTGSEAHWDMIQTVMDSPSEIAMIPAQDLLGLGSEARMNLPGTSAGNWTWRLKSGQLDEALAVRLRKASEASGRARMIK